MASPTIQTRSSARSPAAEYIRGLLDRREFAWYLALGRLKAQTASTSFGLLWWVFNPLLLSAVYFIVFGIIFSGARGDPATYLAYLMSGMFAFHYTRGAIIGGPGIVLNNAQLIENIRFPRLVLPMASIIEALIGLGSSLIVYFAIAPFADIETWRNVWWLLPIVVLHTIMNIGFATLAIRLVLPFRDIGKVIPYLLRLWLYLSPIIWTPDLLDNAPEWLQTAARLNPMFGLFALYRGALMGWQVEAIDLWATVAWAIVFVVVGLTLFVRFERRLVQHL